MITRDELMQVLYDCIKNAPAEYKQVLAESLHAYALRYRGTYKNLSSSDSLIAAILETLELAANGERFKRDERDMPI